MSTSFYWRKILQGNLTVDGVECYSFHDACNKRELLPEDNEWKRALHDKFCSNCSHFSNVFATILDFFQPSSPIDLFKGYRKEFIM